MQPVTLPPYLRRPSLLLLVSLFVALCIVPFVWDTTAPTLSLPVPKHLLSVPFGDSAPSNIHLVRRDEKSKRRETDSEESRVLATKRSSQDKNITGEDSEESPNEGFANSTNPTTPPPTAKKHFAKGKSQRVKPDFDDFMSKNANDVNTGESSLTAVAGYKCRTTSECERCDFADQEQPECQETGYRETVECDPDDVSNDTDSKNSTEPRPVVLVKSRSCSLGKSQETKRFLAFQVVNAVCAVASTFAVIHRRRELNAHQYALLNSRINSV